ncbi:MAG: hypothetical protein J6A19_03235 [Oscillospiraceae bacterium]|nr:hypothetical protein [Oscillospiraceae bacterium]
MKHGKNPTRRQKQVIASHRLNPDNWFVCKDTPEVLVLERRIIEDKKSNKKQTRTIRKELLR